ncbi:helicase [Halorubrum coriense DSM 10284]|uniref:DNA 3'-5' helicase n=1 Tax=Halorubrum coriense DSM 10284 TaxID=1227466 RepID=M0EM77_9EURY|nr:helicase [Halorubrum coriense DSM 10284]
MFDGDDLEHLVDDVLEQRTELVPETFYEHFSNFLLQSELPTVSETDFETKEEFVEHLRREEYETLRGEKVKSRAEKLIADFLYVHQIDYKYEYRADLDQSHSQGDQTGTDSESTDSDADRPTEISAYRPDFYLPEAEIWIEHYGIDEDGQVADWFTQSSEEYIEKIHWAREVFDDRDAVLLETYQFEFDTGRLRQALTHRLTHHHVSLDRRSHEELVNETYEIHNRNIPIQQMFTRFIELARTFEIEPSEIPSRLSIDQSSQYYFGMCGGLLLNAYETRLRESGNIDFTDMIYEAASLLSTGADPATPGYEHVLVDEFQDIGQDQLQLIAQLSGPDNAQLFAVGDDWQSIYSFQGAVVDLFINFEERFEYTATTTLDTNYRSPSQLVKASVELIEQNENQLVKQTTAASDAPAAVVKHLLGGYREYDYVKYTAELVAHLVADYIDSGCDPNEIMVLCRYDDAVSHLDAVRKRLHDRSIPYTSGSDQQDGVTVCSVHQAKGREADHVIVTHASEDGMGFPATDRNSELLEPVREVDMNTLSEERRLFYVAITRSARTLDVITKSNQEDQSRFIDEIDQYVDTATNADRIVSLDPTGNQNTLQARVAHLWDDTHAKKHQGGVLEDHTDSVKVVSWASADPPTVESDTWYRFENISVNEYKGDPQVVINGFSELTEIEPEDARVDVETIHYQLSQDDSSGDTPTELKATEEE